MSGTLIARVSGRTYGASTPHHWDAKGGAGAEKGQSHTMSRPGPQVVVLRESEPLDTESVRGARHMEWHPGRNHNRLPRHPNP